MPKIINDNETQASEWEDLYRQLTDVLERFGNSDPFGKGDYWLLDDNYGTYAQHKIYIHNLRFLKTPAVKLIQQTLALYPRWEVVVAIDIPGGGEAWPDMGLTIRAHEIIDGLRREYFPPEYRSIYFEGSRPGTERD